ncbi:Charged multivesicular body protein 6 [Smittium culicis]|uniref:Charged multivesicular body protein 6 n=1 Tax=Smittium culicis TaxID=133412 RepID=A0A1R1Y6K9_9FUNG|nr:Charged multivesicular body protein 6 [Smittium culicis]
MLGLSLGNDVLKNLNKEMNLENVEKLMLETSDAIEYQNEVSAILHSNLTADDEEQVIEELNALRAEALAEFNERLPNVPKTDLPNSIPVSKNRLRQENEQAEDISPEPEKSEPLLA